MDRKTEGEHMEYRIERDSMGEMQVPADRYWARRRSGASRTL